jgi:hypothetical protein
MKHGQIARTVVDRYSIICNSATNILQGPITNYGQSHCGII